MAIHLTTDATNACAGDGTNAGLRAFIGATPKLRIYTGDQPVNTESDPGGTRLGTITLAAFGAAANSQICSPNSTADAAAVAGGTAGCWALYQSDDATKVCDGTIAQTSGGDINVDNPIIVSGDTLQMHNLYLTVPTN